MKKILSFFALSLIAFTSHAVDAPKPLPVFPKYETVISQFFEEYAPDNLTDESNINFAKMPDGWHVVLYGWNKTSDSFKTIYDACFWSLQQHKYISLQLSKDGSGISCDKIRKKLLSNDVGIIHYNCNPYYGYCGWGSDVINLLMGHADLTDTFLYALSDAYMSDARRAIQLNWSGECRYQKNKNENTAFNFPLYIADMKKCVQYDKALETKNPFFATAIGTPASHRGNDYMTAYLDLQIRNDSTDANTFITDSLYSTAIISMAKNCLSGCAPNAILITGGDMDSYPLLYLQKKYNFRTDVLVMNYNLLGAPEYVEYICSRYPSLFDIKPVLYRGTNNDVVLQKKDVTTPDYMLLDDFMRGIVDPDNNRMTDTMDVMQAYMPAGGVYIPVDKKRFPANSIDRTNSYTDTMYFSFEPGKTYILKNEWLLLRLIQKQAHKRPIYFTGYNLESAVLGIKKYLQVEGIGWHIVPIKYNAVDEYGNNVFNKDIAYYNCINSFSWRGIANDTFTDVIEYSIFQNYRTLFYNLAFHLAENGRMDSAMHILNMINTKLPADKVPYGYESVLAVKTLYLTKHNQAAENLSQQLFTIFDAQIQTFSMLKSTEEMIKNKARLQIAMYVINALGDEYGKEGNTDMSAKMSAYIQKYMPLYQKFGQ